MASIADKDLNQAALSDILNTLLVDVTAQKAAIAAIIAKLNADGWVTDTDYASSGALTTTV